MANICFDNIFMANICFDNIFMTNICFDNNNTYYYRTFKHASWMKNSAEENLPAILGPSSEMQVTSRKRGASKTLTNSSCC